MPSQTFSYLVAGVFLAAVATASSAQTSVSVSVGAPGFYGAIDIGAAPPPTLIYQQPVAVQPVVVGLAPLYLYVPPEQYANWGSYCGYYDACNRNVYFVDRGWYQRVYVPHYRSHRSYYDHRRHEFDHHNYRPSRDAHRAPPSHRSEHRSAPPRADYHRPPAREEHRSAPARSSRPDNNQRSAARDERRSAPSSPPRSDSQRSQGKDRQANRDRDRR